MDYDDIDPVYSAQLYERQRAPEIEARIEEAEARAMEQEAQEAEMTRRNMRKQWIEFDHPKKRGISARILVRASAVQGLEEDGDRCELQLSFGAVSVSGSFEENAAKLRAIESEE
ncbi:hypothetical protein EP7_004342 [Isosphaeraceae bacterium EP7]